MIIRINELQDNCKIILNALDTNGYSILTDTLELISDNGILEMNITNREYYVTVKLNVAQSENIHATVNASLFLKLISKITTDTVELAVVDNNLVVVGNGKYKLPLIYENNVLYELPKIEINNVTVTANISGDILTSIYKYNSRQLTVGAMAKPVQKMFYVDQQGAITFTSGACVNSFTLPVPVKMLLSQKLVKMFNLFKGIEVKFSFGYDTLTDNIVQTKVKFETENIIITAILSNDDSLLSSVPVQAIRDRAFNVYNNTVTINKNELSQTIERLMLFLSATNTKYSKFIFTTEGVNIYSPSGDNSELIYYSKSDVNDNTYEAILDLADIKTILDGISDTYITVSYGDHQAVVISTNTVHNVVPEVIRS